MDQKAGKRRGASVKTLKKVLKKAGLKTTGKKATLTRRAKKAKLMKGGHSDVMCSPDAGGPDVCPSRSGNCPGGYSGYLLPPGSAKNQC